MLINNHTAVWGSHWRDGAWGYACCHQFVKNSYCIGDAGSKAADEQTAQVQRLEPSHLFFAVALYFGHLQLLAIGSRFHCHNKLPFDLYGSHNLNASDIPLATPCICAVPSLVYAFDSL